MLLNDKEIKKLAVEKKMLEPFVDHKVQGKLSYGLDPFGYTIRLSNEFKYFKEIEMFDPLLDNEKFLADVEGDVFLLSPGSFVLGRSVEYFRMPPDVTGIAFTKSSYARLGIFANITTIDAGWEGFLTIEVANLGSNPVKLYANKGIAQIHFFKGKVPENSYSGKYQNLDKIKV